VLPSSVVGAVMPFIFFELIAKTGRRNMGMDGMSFAHDALGLVGVHSLRSLPSSCRETGCTCSRRES
jgi:hypothetical protein